MATRDEIINDPVEWGRHVVILGTGASRAAAPHGDKSGRLVPTLHELEDVAGDRWHDLVRRESLEDLGFEAQFAELRRRGIHSRDLHEVELRITEYFENLSLPDSATLYDYLVLGLRSKDLIASFNWDPFLSQAYQRNRPVTESLPDVRFLHGNVFFATCDSHDTLGLPGQTCSECAAPLQPVPLLFPDDVKDYTSNSRVVLQWEKTIDALRNCFQLTIFGYSGPKTDAEARRRLFEGWVETPLWDLSHLEIIDVADPDSLRDNWAPFFPLSHELITSDFWSSSIARWPRRTDKWKKEASLNGEPCESLGPFRTDSLQELQSWFGPLLAAEESLRSG